ncbi:hypothetical protein GLOTRDRAFT_99489 [Gloeophyllum trabeum ATCC 11539]|uniref:Uncharacterized protein n=1 Tax=Gloeophyllum trabeum (strain ATCC 11539 / FP-39264 / Madison 617) TaxID=670483 RepID=S7QE25_GLOTA|nr:uncharacterized protein GLOTRDRAFT_99489 [Gloeophyllum trabeum ATCC 11539]EPQ57667.1 hypothetical protein GLOTRDRAFT_99489 [Gloeophyllum trabeum ATCC 11539]
MYSALVLAIAAGCASALTLQKRAVDFYAPTAGGGSELDNAGDGYGEPLNIIISGLSSPAVLTDDGFMNFAHALGYSEECLDLHAGGAQSANLGDGNGWVDQLIEIREDYGSTAVGTCLESLVGGNHFRVWRQNGSLADSGALFLAVSKEEDVFESHTIVPDGYDIGRNLLAQAAVGTTSYGGVTYSTTARNVTGLIAPGSDGVNHGIAQDGIVTVLTVEIVS